MRPGLKRRLGPGDAWHCFRCSLIAYISSGDTTSSRISAHGKRPLRFYCLRSSHSTAKSPRFSLTDSSYSSSGLLKSVWRTETDHKASNIKEKQCHQDLDCEPQRGLSQYVQSTDADYGEQVLWRLLDADEYHNNFNIWFDLAQNRGRAHGLEGIRIVWRALSKRRLYLPTTGRTADELWTYFLDLGFKDPEVLEEILLHASKQKESQDRAWPDLYAVVVGHYLRVQPDDAWSCHMRLHKQFSPSSQQFGQLLALALHDEKLRQKYLSMHAFFPHIHIYDCAIPQLCRQGLYATAVRWHEKLIKRGDCPSDARIAEPVLRYLAVNNDQTRLKESIRSMVENGVSFAAYRDKNIKVPLFISRDIVMPPLGNPNKEPEKKISDGFCARLFATKFFSIDIVIGSLVFLGAEEIGPQALREMAARELDQAPYHRAVQARLDQLKENGIFTGDSTFSIMVRKFIAERRDDLLRAVISCDLHSDTFEDQDLQESLLPRYQEQGDTTAFTRTITILTAKLPERLVESKRWNYVLRSFLTRRDIPGITKTIEKMQELHVVVETKSIMLMRQTMLSPRNPGHRPLSTKELDMLIRVWKSVLCSGSFIPPKAWTEILRRLGMSGQLQAFESLALWLANWYSSPGFRESQLCVFGRKHHTTEILHHPLMSIDLKPSDPQHPFQTLFPRSLQQGIVAWGFQHTNLNQIPDRGNPDWSWGIALLRTLRSVHNVHIPTPLVAKAFKMRLLTIFGPTGRSRRKINNASEPVRRKDASFFAKKAGQIWGEDLFRGEKDLSMLQKRKKVVIEEGRRVGGWTI